MKIRIKVGEKEVTATLNDSEAAREFASLLPLIILGKIDGGIESLKTSGAVKVTIEPIE